ncbi:MAG: 3-hydroxyacyl-CoA dehydrogenase [Candidatus Methylomirabilis sp.]|nr:3-hydroxyacyl-CoA dehydrogenase [Deltaproteobacteria bacterium]
MDVSKTVAIITGGASGLGEATAKRLIGAGGKVAILDRPQSNGEALAKEWGESAIFTPADVTDEAAVSAAVEKTVERFGGVHVCVNCAGVGSAVRTVSKMGPFPLEMFEMTVKINLIGTFNVLRLAAAQMAKQEPNAEGERGVIVNTASIAAFDGQVGQVAYSASKAGIVGMTLPIARDLASLGVRCLTICPGTMDTPMLALLPPDQRELLAVNIQFPKRLGRPEEFAMLVEHLVENPYINGETIRLDGGLRMQPK